MLTNIFQMGWFNHQLEFSSNTKKEVIDSKVFFNLAKKLVFFDIFHSLDAGFFCLVTAVDD